MTDPDTGALDIVIGLLEIALGREVQLYSNSLTRSEIPYETCIDEDLEDGEIEFR